MTMATKKKANDNYKLEKRKMLAKLRLGTWNVTSVKGKKRITKND